MKATLGKHDVINMDDMMDVNFISFIIDDSILHRLNTRFKILNAICMDGQSALTLRLDHSSTKIIIHSNLPFIAKTTWRILRKIPWERIEGVVGKSIQL